MLKRANVIIASAAVMTGILFVRISSAQEPSRDLSGTGGMGYSLFGSATISVTDLNAKLESKGYSVMSDNFFSVGGGGHKLHKNGLIIGGEGHALLGEETSTGNYKNSIYMVSAFFDVGYVLYSLQELRVYPLLGIGVGGMNLSIVEKATALTFDEVLDDPGRGTQLSTDGLLINLALGIDYLLKFGEDATGKGGMLLGIRAGYTLSPLKNDWTVDTVELSGVPEMSMTGPYVRFMIGGGGIAK